MQQLKVVFESIVLEERPGFISVMFQGEGSARLYANESGGHRWQRTPPNEKRGRTHTSTVTVAIIDPNDTTYPTIDYSDVEISTTRGSGPGGQNRNKVETCVVVTHKPTGTTVRIDGRSQHQNKQVAMKLLASRVYEKQQQQLLKQQEQARRAQVGTGMRGDKIRTYRTQDDQVTDHRTGQRWRLRDWVKGIW